MAQESGTSVWTVEIRFARDGDVTRADARLHTDTGVHEVVGWGRSRRSPVDPDIPDIGEEIAAGRALWNLAGHLMHEAVDQIEDYKETPTGFVG